MIADAATALRQIATAIEQFGEKNSRVELEWRASADAPLRADEQALAGLRIVFSDDDRISVKVDQGEFLQIVVSRTQHSRLAALFNVAETAQSGYHRHAESYFPLTNIAPDSLDFIVEVWW